MTQPDIRKHLVTIVGEMALQLATAQAVIEQLTADVAALQEARTKDEQPTGGPDGRDTTI